MIKVIAKEEASTDRSKEQVMADYISLMLRSGFRYIIVTNIPFSTHENDNKKVLAAFKRKGWKIEKLNIWKKKPTDATPTVYFYFFQ